LVAAQVQDFGPAHTTATTKFLAASTAEGGNGCGGSASECFNCADSRSSVEWTEESSEEDLDYFAALDVAAAEASPRVADAGDAPGPGDDDEGRLQNVELVGRRGLGFVWVGLAGRNCCLCRPP
jgi:hypothetical protein